MKKLLCLVLALMLALSVFAACGKKNDSNEEKPATEEATPAENEDNTEEGNAPSGDANSSNPSDETGSAPSPDVPAPSDNKEVVTTEDAPDVYLVVGSDDNAVSISYHLKSCKHLSGVESQQISWDMVKTLGFRQCPECNPPRYEGYIE
ncbi:MAG: hypothetical protein J6R66_06165 [Clostridia bacterium]|nr:hypothetical protein [Clostridia bacterium]